MIAAAFLIEYFGWGKVTMNINWFKNPDNVVYADQQEFLPRFSKEIGVSNLAEEVEEFLKNPSAEGKLLHGKKRTSLKLIIPDLLFQERLEMGENVWIYLGENHVSYCLYTPWQEEKESWRDKNYSFFSHKSCEYFPCHKGLKEEEFNCLFCYCPLYALKDRCGGNFKYSDNIKDCSKCALPHHKKNYGYIMGKFSEIVKISQPDNK